MAKNLPAEQGGGTKMVLVRAIRVHTYGNGLCGIEVPARELSEAEHKVLGDLFPNTLDQAHMLLDKECLIDSMHSGPLPKADYHKTYDLDIVR